MKNETIKTYTPITVEQAGEMLRDNNWKPVDGLRFKDCGSGNWQSHDELLTGIDLENGGDSFYTEGNGYAYCATVTELDPCLSPDGCPELEPWMAYVGIKGRGDFVRGKCPSLGDCYALSKSTFQWVPVYHSLGGVHCAIDVRTAFAQEHFPEHCRIRNYQEQDPFDVAWKAERVVLVKHPESICRFYYELGQANPNQPTK